MNSKAKKALLTVMGMLLALSLSRSAFASPISISFTLSQSTQTGAAGGTLKFFGTIVNTGSSTVFLNSDNFTLSSSVLSINDQPFFSNAPASLGSSGTSGEIELFDITIASNAAVGTYGNNTFAIIGGATNNDFTDILATQPFTVNVAAPSPVPEPNTIVLLAGGIMAIASRKLIRR